MVLSYRIYGVLIITPYLFLAITFHMYLQTYEGMRRTSRETVAVDTAGAISNYFSRDNNINDEHNDNKKLQLELAMENHLQHKLNFFPVIKNGKVQKGRTSSHSKTAGKINYHHYYYGNKKKAGDAEWEVENRDNDKKSYNNDNDGDIDINNNNNNDRFPPQSKLTFNGRNNKQSDGDFNVLDGQNPIHQQQPLQQQQQPLPHISYRFRDLRLKYQPLNGYQSQDELLGGDHRGGQWGGDFQQEGDNNKRSVVRELISPSSNKMGVNSKNNRIDNKNAGSPPRIRIKHKGIETNNNNNNNYSNSSNNINVNYPQPKRHNDSQDYNQLKQGFFNEINDIHVTNSVTRKSVKLAGDRFKFSPLNAGDHSNNNTHNSIEALLGINSSEFTIKFRNNIRNGNSGSFHSNNKPASAQWNSNFPLQDHCYPPSPQGSESGTAFTQNVQFQSLKGNYIYSAYLDDRLDTSSLPVVRVFAIIEVTRKTQYFCHFFNTTNHSAANVKTQSNKKGAGNSYETRNVQYYEMCENHGKTFGGWILTCEIPAHMVKTPPCHVVISVHSRYDYTADVDGSINVTVLTTNPGINYTVSGKNNSIYNQKVFQKSQLNEFKGSPVLNISQLNEFKGSPVLNMQSNHGNPVLQLAEVNSRSNNNINNNIIPPKEVAVYKQKQNFGICVPPLFGYIPSTTLIEFIELSKLLGADHIVFYVHDVSSEIHRVLKYYRQEGAISVIPWAIPVKNDNNIWYHGQLLAINDCLYRSMHRFKYVAFNDLDEFIVPKQHVTNWLDMIKSFHVGSSQSIFSGYSFQSAFFDPLSSSSRMLYDLESDLRTKSFSKVRSKVMVMPDRIYELGIHHISKSIYEGMDIYYVNTSQAYIHHYRQCMTDFDHKMNCQVYARDETLSHYIPTLRHNVHKTTWMLKELEKQYERLEIKKRGNIRVRNIL